MCVWVCVGFLLTVNNENCPLYYNVLNFKEQKHLTICYSKTEKRSKINKTKSSISMCRIYALVKNNLTI